METLDEPYSIIYERSVHVWILRRLDCVERVTHILFREAYTAQNKQTTPTPFSIPPLILQVCVSPTDDLQQEFSV